MSIIPDSAASRNTSEHSSPVWALVTLFFAPAFIGIFTYLPFYLTGPTFRLPPIALGLVYLLWLTGIFSPVAGAIAGRTGSRCAIAFTMGLGDLGLLVTLVPVLSVVLIGLGFLDTFTQNSRWHRSHYML